MSEIEIPLKGGTHGPVVRVGNTVRRQAREATPTIHALLRHLERAGFDGAPRTLGMDEQGREVLSFMPGEVPVFNGTDALPAYVREEHTLIELGRLVRRYHDATVEFTPPAGARWAFQVGAPTSGDVICHNDLGPWNTVFADGLPTCFIDWDGATPGSRAWDVAYVLYRFVPFVPDDICALIGWPRPPDRTARVACFCDAYGLGIEAGILDVMVERIHAMIATGNAGHAAGEPKFGIYWENVMKKRLQRDLDFVRTHTNA